MTTSAKQGRVKLEVMVVAGEASGDRHAADVVAAVQARRPDVRFFGMGGPSLQARGVELIHGSHEISVMGLTEVLPKVPRILKVLGDLTEAAKARRPKVALLVDVPDFNLRLAKRLKAMGVKVAWYISPMVWAWRRGRVHTIARRVDRMLCILPFEEAFYAEAGVPARYVGSPVLEQVPPSGPAEPFRRALGLDERRKTLALLPGSRRSEISRILPTLVEAAGVLVALHPGLQLVVPVAPGLPRELIEAPFLAAGLAPRLIEGRAAEVVGASDVAVVASGTATLEAGLMRRPLVVVYRMAPLSYLVGRAMIHLPHFSLINLLARREVVPELLQGQLTVRALVDRVEPLWSGPAREAQLRGLDEVRAGLGTTGAAGRVADELLVLLEHVD